MQKRLHRIPLVVAAISALFIAMWTGLLRIGWQLPSPRTDFPFTHGPLMVCGFLGTLIIVERAVSLESFLKGATQKLPYFGALLTVVGSVMLVAGVEGSPALLFICAGSLGLVFIFAYIIKIHPTTYTVAMGGGALAWFIGNMTWLLGEPFYVVVPWWMVFLVLTIAGERLELSRMARVPESAQRLFAGLLAALFVSAIITQVDLSTGLRLMGIMNIAVAVWLLRYDIARHTIRKEALPRFVAACLLLGYAWLIVSGLIALTSSELVIGPRYDAMLHTLFLGFAFSMIFGHAPIIFPAILNMQITYRPAFYVHLVLLHLSLTARVMGDLFLWHDVRRWGGLTNALVIIIFLLNTILAVLQSGENPVLSKDKVKAAQLAVLLPIPVFLLGLFLVGVGFFASSEATAPLDITPTAISVGESTEEAVTPLPAATVDVRMVERGEEHFILCAACHGEDGAGLPGLGKSLLTSEFVALSTDAELLTFIKRGRPIWDSENTTGIDMPAMGGNPSLTDDDILAIIAYLRAIRQTN